MLLDSGPWSRFEGEVDQLRLRGLRIVFASSLAEEYQISQTPQVYVVGADGTVLAAGRTFDLAAFNGLVGVQVRVAKALGGADVTMKEKMYAEG
jgi:hypothetical protein